MLCLIGLGCTEKLHQPANPHCSTLSARAEVLVSPPRMFATLDPTIRAIRLPSHRRVLVSDTVGFIRDLPKVC